MKRILFVDDNLLMREMYEAFFSSERAQWEVVTAPGGPEALELMKQNPFDVVASDMRMDGMNGIELLTQVAKLYPQTSRLIVSGVADEAEAADALGLTHQFLVKPVNFEALRDVLRRIVVLDAFLQEPNLRSLAGRLRTLPTFPLLYLEIMKVIDEPDAPLQSVHSLVAKDPALSAKILQIVNSVAIGLGQKVNDPFFAIQQLGLNTLRSLALSAHVFASFTPSQKLNFPLEVLWSHLLRCGETARLIMRAENAAAATVDAAYTAGLMHDIGKLMLADSLPEAFQHVLTRAATRNVPFYEIETEMFGASHAGLAAYLLGLWGLPAPIVEAVAFHHSPRRTSCLEFSPLTAVHVANALEHERDGGDFHLDTEYLDLIGVSDRLDAWREATEKTAED